LQTSTSISFSILTFFYFFPLKVLTLLVRDTFVTTNRRAICQDVRPLSVCRSAWDGRAL